ncbi:MAG TPA: isoamylase early set domain-containing protein [Candidatus Omnitrophota bacterium]|nr:isoamylase early set domain-containing protein [Candidatus Omnitrophota bacterium]HQO38229.1 isoamylase early set domain-containing protein [Candidatus Omnitrophota bacterium]HQQ06242.1 isoamylase early set domain-containing protein [Candidatus Omnitrophota bacterium]
MPKAAVSSSRVKSTQFQIFAPQAKKVSVAGSFNNWDPKKVTAKKDTKGNWAVSVSLKPGRYEYKFLIDGSWVNDPKCNNAVYNTFGTQNSVVEVK